MRRRISCIVLLIVLTLFLTISPALSYDPEKAKSNLASDYSDCAAYYIFTSEAVKKNSEEDLAKQALEAYQAAISLAIELSNFKVTDARVELSLNAQKELIDNNLSNFAILILKYGDLCKELLVNPEKRIKYWLEKE